MTSPLFVLNPLTVTPAMLTATDVTENDYPAIANSHVYALGDRVISTTTHKIYECILAYTSAGSAVTPDADPTHWTEVSATNRWKPFDTSNSTQVQKATSFYYELTPAIPCTAVAVLNAGASTVRWRVTDATAGVVYDKTWNLFGSITEPSWWNVFFERRQYKTQQVAFDLPSYKDAVYRVDVAGALASAGAILIGQGLSFGMGITQGVKLGIQSYSRIATDDFGETVFVKRLSARKFDIVVPIENKNLDAVYTLLSQLDAVPCVWSGPRYDAMTIFGFYKDFQVLIAYTNYSEVSLSVQGLT